MKLSRELKTGIIAIGGILLFIMGFSYLKSSPLFDNSKTLYAVYKNIGGLQTGTPVMINGYTVGKVNEIKFKDKSGDLLVAFSVSSEFEFSKKSLAELYDTGIIGGKGIQIIPNFEGALVQSGDTLKTESRPGITDLVQDNLGPLKVGLENAFSNADSLLVNVNDLLDAKTKKELQEAIAGLNTMVGSFRNTSNSVNSLVANNEKSLGESLKNLETMTANFSRLSASLADAGLDETLASFKKTIDDLNGLLDKMNRGDGTLAKLMKDEALYNNLESASKELDLLLQDFRLNPKRYVNVSVFGKKQKDYTVPENDPADKIDN